MDKERELAKKLLTALEGDPDVLTYLQYVPVPKKTFNTEYDVDKLLKAGANNFTQQTGSLNRSLASMNTSSLLQDQLLDGSNNSSAPSKNSLGNSGYTSFTSDGAGSILAGASKNIATQHFALQKKQREERKNVFNKKFEENHLMEKKFKNFAPEDWVKNKIQDIEENPEKPPEILEAREFLQGLFDPTMGQLGEAFPNRERAWESFFPNQYTKLPED